MGSCVRIPPGRATPLNQRPLDLGASVSFDVRGGAADADAVCARLELMQHATSFGAVESTMERRAAVAGQEHLPRSLLRLSVGIEDAEDLWRDLDQALLAVPRV